MPDPSRDAREKHFAEIAWLNYFNRYLYAHGTISESEFRRMSELIARRQRTSAPGTDRACP